MVVVKVKLEGVEWGNGDGEEKMGRKVGIGGKGGGW